MIETYADAINYIHGRHKWKKTPSFERIEQLLAALGNPHFGLKYIHVTGTNGKGSTSKMMAELLQTAGLQVGLFTSPFIMRFNERIQINSQPIPDDRLVAIMQRIEPILEHLDTTLADGGPTEFETLSAAMFVYFAEEKVDVVVLEVGVGGTWDTTNIIQDKLAAVITTIGYDHMAVLGNTLGEIATQKAGIIHHNRPTIIGQLPAEARPAVDAVSGELLVLNEDFQIEDAHVTASGLNAFSFNGLREIQDIVLSLRGAYQQQNAAIAIETVLRVQVDLGRVLSPDQIRDTLQSVQWMARFEKIAANPLTIIDGAHNQHGVDALITTLSTQYREQHIEVIFGVLADKNYAEMLADLVALPNVHLNVVGFQSPASRETLDPHAAKALLPETDMATFDDWQTGYAAVRDLATTEMIVFTGSLYFVSDVRQVLVQA